MTRAELIFLVETSLRDVYGVPSADIVAGGAFITYITDMVLANGLKYLRYEVLEDVGNGAGYVFADKIMAYFFSNQNASDTAQQDGRMVGVRTVKDSTASIEYFQNKVYHTPNGVYASIDKDFFDKLTSWKRHVFDS